MNDDSPLIEVRPARIGDTDRVLALLHEAAAWLCEQKMPMWHESEIASEAISRDVREGLFFVAEHAGEVVAAFKFQLEDSLFWPDVPPDESAFLHRLVVSRAYAGRGVSTSIFQWAVQRAVDLEKSYLRLDCEASRPKLRAVYEAFGFRYHSDRQVGPFFVARYEYVLTNNALDELKE